MLMQINFKGFDFCNDSEYELFLSDENFVENVPNKNIFLVENDIGTRILDAIKVDLSLCEHVTTCPGKICLVYLYKKIYIEKHLTVFNDKIKQATVLFDSELLSPDGDNLGCEFIIVDNLKLNEPYNEALNKINDFETKTIKFNEELINIDNIDDKLKYILKNTDDSLAMFFGDLMLNLSFEAMVEFITIFRENKYDNIQRFYNIDLKHSYMLNNLAPKTCRIDNTYYVGEYNIYRYSDFGFSKNGLFKRYVLQAAKAQKNNKTDLKILSDGK